MNEGFFKGILLLISNHSLLHFFPFLCRTESLSIHCPTQQQSTSVNISISWQVAKNKIEEYTTSKWKQKWTTAPHYKHTKLFYESPNKNKSKYISKMGTYMLSTWIKSITGYNNLAYFQSKLNPEIDPTCRLCLQANETLHHLMTDCEATISLQMDIMKNQIQLPDMTWSVKS